MTSTQIPSDCTVCTTGHAAPWPNGERATSAASSRTIGTSSSASSTVPAAAAAAITSAADAGLVTTHTPLPSYPPRMALRISGQPVRVAKSASAWAGSAATDRSSQRGTGTPSSPSRVRMTALSCACRSAPGPGYTVTPSATNASTCSAGTCSWSKVITSHPAAKRRRSASER